MIVGGIIGFLSGIIGVGGGIFLSPIILIFGWSDPKTTAGIAAVFIWVNSFGRTCRQYYFWSIGS